MPPEKTDRLVTGYGTNFETGALEVYDERVGGQWNEAPAFPVGRIRAGVDRGRLQRVRQMLLRGGAIGRDRVLARPSVELMTSDQLTAAQKAHGAAMVPGFFDDNGWGFGVAVVTRRRNASDIGRRVRVDRWPRYIVVERPGGGHGDDPADRSKRVDVTQRCPPLHLEFATAAYAAIDD